MFSEQRELQLITLCKCKVTCEERAKKFTAIKKAILAVQQVAHDNLMACSGHYEAAFPV